MELLLNSYFDVAGLKNNNALAVSVVAVNLSGVSCQ
jgi:hypothetical protein